jgi:peroxiredoxin
VEKKNLEFHVLSDVGNRVARSYGLVFKLPEPIVAVPRGLGVDLEKSNGDLSGELPVPATFVVASDGRIAHASVNADYRERLEPAEIIRVLEKLGNRR